MKIRKKGYWLLLILTIIFTLLAVLTILPDSNASHVSMLGYRAHCTFAPIGTLLCLIPAGITCFIRKRFFVTYR